MVARLDPCNPDALRLLLNDRLPPAAVGELESHLEFCPTCRRSLDAMAGGESWSSAVRDHLGGTADPEPADPAHDPLDFLAPSSDPNSLGRVGRYEVSGVLGRGGNGVVLKAFDPNLNRYVAVKVIASVLSGSGAARQRFRREAHAAAAVVHEHVVAVHDVEEANGLPYLVMEYVPGRSLQDRLDRQGPLELREILRIAHQTAAGLAAAHAQGLVHRDIKPANILLENGVERVKITDFGLARAVADASLTQSGVITGTPHYMAPEQARGEAVDHRADLFSLGSTIYAMATGHPPFRADTPLAVLRRVTDETPRPIREVNPDMPAWLDGIVAKLLAKDPADRFQSAAEVAALFERCLAHVQQPMTVALPAVPALPRPGRERPRWQTRLEVAAGMLVVAVGVGVVLSQAGRDRTATGLPEPSTASQKPNEQKVVVVATEQPGRENGSQITLLVPPEFRFAEKDLDDEFRMAWAGPFDEYAHAFRTQMRVHRSWEKVRKVLGPGPDLVDVILDHLRDESWLTETKMTAPRRMVKTQPDPIERELEAARRRAEALERELTVSPSKK
jgi:serine/threonine-protein kinase